MFGLSNFSTIAKLVGFGAVIAIIGGLAALWRIDAAELASCQGDRAKIVQAEKSADSRAQAAQALAYLQAAKIKRLQREKGQKATVRASQIAQAARSGEIQVRQKVQNIASHNASEKAWQDTPVPASVLEAIQGGGQ